MAMPDAVHCTYLDVLEYDGPVELMDGQLVALSSPSRRHQAASRSLTVQLANYLSDKKCQVYPAPFDIKLFADSTTEDIDVDTVVVPDLSVICDPGKLDDRGCNGAPDLIIEILSSSTQQHDRLTKFNLYQQAGVKEYWLVDPDNNAIQVFWLENGHYTAKSYAVPGDKLQVLCLDNCIIDVSAVFEE